MTYLTPAFFATALLLVGCDASSSGADDAAAPDAQGLVDSALEPDAAVADMGPQPDAAPQDAGTVDAAVERPAPVCPGRSDARRTGDINADSYVDVGDAVALQNYYFRGGPAPVCAAASDFNGDGRLQVDDSYLITTWLVTGFATPEAGRPECPDGAFEAGGCAPITFGWEGPTRVDGDSTRGRITLWSPEAPVQGWSYSLTVEGCEIEGATTLGTAAADHWDDPPGLRHLGYSVAQPVEGGLVAYTILSHSEDRFLPDSPTAVLDLGLRVVDPPAFGCPTCTVRVGGGLRWTGEEIRSVVSANGLSYRTSPKTFEVLFCPNE